MKRFTVNCTFSGGETAPFHIYVGEPAPSLHPLKFQSAWLLSRRSGTIPPEVMENFEKLHAIALENKVSFEELCAYALGTENKKPDTDTPAAEDAAPGAPAMDAPSSDG